MAKIPFTPNQKGDFIKDDRGKRVKYQGPIWDVTYPPEADNMEEMASWMGWGYEILVGHSYDLSKGFTIRVMGDIPKEARENMKRNRMTCTLTKERGPVMSLESTAAIGV